MHDRADLQRAAADDAHVARLHGDLNRVRVEPEPGRLENSWRAARAPTTNVKPSSARPAVVSTSPRRMAAGGTIWLGVNSRKTADRRADEAADASGVPSLKPSTALTIVSSSGATPGSSAARSSTKRATCVSFGRRCMCHTANAAGAQRRDDRRSPRAGQVPDRRPKQTFDHEGRQPGHRRGKRRPRHGPQRRLRKPSAPHAAQIRPHLIALGHNSSLAKHLRTCAPRARAHFMKPFPPPTQPRAPRASASAHNARSSAPPRFGEPARQTPVTRPLTRS